MADIRNPLSNGVCAGCLRNGGCARYTGSRTISSGPTGSGADVNGYCNSHGDGRAISNPHVTPGITDSLSQSRAHTRNSHSGIYAACSLQ